MYIYISLKSVSAGLSSALISSHQPSGQQGSINVVFCRSKRFCTSFETEIWKMLVISYWVALFGWLVGCFWFCWFFVSLFLWFSVLPLTAFDQDTNFIPETP